jgi:hypothetical protein
VSPAAALSRARVRLLLEAGDLDALARAAHASDHDPVTVFDHRTLALRATTVAEIASLGEPHARVPERQDEGAAGHR